MQRSVVLVLSVMMLSLLIGCGETAAEEPASTSEIESEVVSEEVSEAVSEEVSEVAVSEEVAEEEPVIVNVILTREEADAYIEDLKVKYPEMSEEEIVTLFVNFNIHSLDEETITYYTTNYDCLGIKNIVSDKLDAINNTYYIITGSDNGIEYKETWNLADFITNEELKKFAQKIEDYMTNMVYTLDDNAYVNFGNHLNDYMYGTNSIGFTFDYNSEQREDTDLDGICFFIAYYNFQYNSDNIGFSDFVSQEVLYTPVEKYQMELNGEE